MSRDSGTGSGFGINIEVDSDLAGGISEKDELMVRSVFLRAQQSRRRRPGGDEGRSPDRHRNSGLLAQQSRRRRPSGDEGRSPDRHRNSGFLAQQSRRRRPGGDEGRSPDRHRNALLRMKMGIGIFIGVLRRRTAAGPSLGDSGSPPGRRLLLWLRIKTRFRDLSGAAVKICFRSPALGAQAR